MCHLRAVWVRRAGVAVPVDETDVHEDELAAFALHVEEPQAPLSVHDSASTGASQSEPRSAGHDQRATGERVMRALCQEEIEGGAIRRIECVTHFI